MFCLTDSPKPKDIQLKRDIKQKKSNKSQMSEELELGMDVWHI